MSKDNCEGRPVGRLHSLSEEQFTEVAQCLQFQVLWFASGMALMDWSGERVIVWVGYDKKNAFKRMATVRGKLMRRQRCQRMGARKGNVNYPHLAGVSRQGVVSASLSIIPMPGCQDERDDQPKRQYHAAAKGQ